jgi:hypothetical protein
MAVGTSSITIRAIYNEINGTSHGTNATIGSGVTMSSLRTASVAYTGGAGSSPNVKTTPDRFNEWADYTHSSGMGTIDYNVRLATSAQSSSYGLKNQSGTIESQTVARAEGGITIWRTHDASNTYIKAKRYADGSSGNLSLGSYHNGTSDQGFGSLTTSTTGTTIITIPIGSDDVSGGVTISYTITAISGTLINYSPTSPGEGSGVPDDMSGTGASLIAARGGTALEVSPGAWPQYVQTKWLVQLTASATGYDTTVLNDGTSNAGIICWQLTDVTAEQY